MTRAAEPEDGFTLIEALVSLVLGAMVLAAVLGTVKVAGRGADRARAALADAEGFARAGSVLAGDMAHALWLAADETGRPVFEGWPDRVVLPQVPRPTGDGMPRPPVLVTYRIDRGAVLRAEAGGAEARLWQAPGRIEFRFLDRAGDWQRDWDQPVLPRALAVADPADGTLRLVAALPDLLPMACASGPGPMCPLAAEAFP